MLDARLIAGIALVGLAAVLVKAVELYDWHVNRQPIIDTRSNGGVKRLSCLH